jgi:hypothetical protein
LRGGLRASLDSSTLKATAHNVSPNRRKFRDLWTGALSGIGNNRTENPGKAFGRNGTGNRLKEPTPSPVLRPSGVPALLRIGRMTDTSPPNGNCEAPGTYANVNTHIIIDLLDLRLRL